jgi:hypothetical protein
MGPDLQYATEKPADTIELRVYPGADGSFTLYEDESDNYNYEKGQYAKIPFTWNDAAQTLTIGARQGAFPGMLDKRVFNVVVVSTNHGSGQGFTATPDARVAYDGTAISVKNGQVSGALRSKSNHLVHFASLTRKVLHIVASNEDSWKVRVLDLRGRTIFSMEENGSKNIMLNQALSKGMYMLSVQFLNDKTATRQKFIVQ